MVGICYSLWGYCLMWVRLGFFLVRILLCLDDCLPDCCFIDIINFESDYNFLTNISLWAFVFLWRSPPWWCHCFIHQKKWNHQKYYHLQVVHHRRTILTLLFLLLVLYFHWCLHLAFFHRCTSTWYLHFSLCNTSFLSQTWGCRWFWRHWRVGFQTSCL